MWTRSLIAATAALAIAAPAFAQSSMSSSSTTGQAAQDSTMGSTTSSGFIAAQQSGQTMASSLMGATVTDSSGKSLGEISDLIVSRDNRVAGVVVDVGGVLGIGAHSVAVPLQKLQLQTVKGEEQAVLSMSQKELKQAPEFKTLSEMQDEQSSGGKMKNPLPK